MKGEKKTYNTGDSPVVTHLSTDPALSSLSMGERTGSRVFLEVWSYVIALLIFAICKVVIVMVPSGTQSSRQRGRDILKTHFP